ncbi:hypothetical protein PS838_01468 [Pseudomonas fluorescens]|nr:hypothetical protein PS838_01468 [Pseudomonas fluorescens]
MITTPKIVTFYSYKGGVGRTMALANVAFLAAANGKKVLVMDWDLEAPGLAYYFRGLLDASQAKFLRDTPGLLDIFWNWNQSAGNAKSKEQAEDLIQQAACGLAFSKHVKTLVSEDLISDITGKPLTLDYIGAGSLTIGEHKKISYEDALSKFSWSDFFEKYAGGVLLESLKNWAKRSYELVLIDSRTGFADVAGICTMQLPDTVALCFVMNRQNIDGTARVAAAVREIRDEQVEIRAVPMRLARTESSEGSDAEARAISELTRIGGFSPAALQEDMRALSIQTYDDVPSYETLALFAARDASYDQLTLDYAKLASNIIGSDVKIPSFDAGSVELIKRRLRPRHATAEFLKTLTQREPARAISEYRQLLESAFETVINEDHIDQNYIEALIQAGEQIADVAPDHMEALSLRMEVIDLLRVLADADEEIWKILLVDKLGDLCNLHSYLMEDDLELSLLEELDTILATFSTLNLKLRRIYFRRSAALIYLRKKDAESTMRSIGEMSSLRRDMPDDKLAQDQLFDLKYLDVEIARLKAEVTYMKGDYFTAATEFDEVVELAGPYNPTSTSVELDRSRYFALYRLTEMPLQVLNALELAQYALRATRECWSVQRLAVGFIHLANVVLRVEPNNSTIYEFCLALTAGGKPLLSHLANYYGRHPGGTIEFLKTVRGLISVVQTHPDNQVRHQLGEFFADAVSQVMRAIMRRRRTIGEKHRNALEVEFELLRTLFDRLSVHVEMYNSELDSRFFSSNERHSFNIDEDF